MDIDSWIVQPDPTEEVPVSDYVMEEPKPKKVKSKLGTFLKIVLVFVVLLVTLDYYVDPLIIALDSIANPEAAKQPKVTMNATSGTKKSSPVRSASESTKINTPRTAPKVSEGEIICRTKPTLISRIEVRSLDDCGEPCFENIKFHLMSQKKILRVTRNREIVSVFYKDRTQEVTPVEIKEDRRTNLVLNMIDPTYDVKVLSTRWENHKECLPASEMRKQIEIARQAAEEAQQKADEMELAAQKKMEEALLAEADLSSEDISSEVSSEGVDLDGKPVKKPTLAELMTDSRSTSEDIVRSLENSIANNPDAVHKKFKPLTEEQMRDMHPDKQKQYNERAQVAKELDMLEVMMAEAKRKDIEKLKEMEEQEKKVKELIAQLDELKKKQREAQQDSD